MASEETPISELIVSSGRHLEHFRAYAVHIQWAGLGAVDFVTMFKAINEVRDAGWMSAEVFDYAPGSERVACERVACIRRIEAAQG